MRAASGLLVAVLLTTCVISGTFAKYVTSVDGTDSARVAKWGFTGESTITLDKLFKDTYQNNGEDTVKSSTDVIAPGTSGEASFGFSYGGNSAVNAPEVAYQFKVDTTGSTCDDSIKNNENIVWSLDDHECKASDDKKSWDVLLDKIQALQNNSENSNNYKPGELPTNFGSTTTTHKVSWEWKFDDNSTTKDEATNAQNKQDTGMGNAETLANVTLKITITATQID